MESWGPNEIFAWVATMLILAGLVFCGPIFYGFFINFRTRKWPSTEGIIVKSRDRHSEKSVTTLKKSAGITPTLILYSYSVEGEDYLCHQVQKKKSMKVSSSRAGKIAEKYPLDAKVRVYYNPENPGVALLELPILGLDMFILNAIPILLGLGLIATGLIIFFGVGSAPR